MSEGYIHSYTEREQNRLLRQSLFLEPWIYEGLDLANVRSLVEIGCGVGAQLQILRRRFPQLRLVGIDRERTQIDKASALLASEVADGQVQLKVAHGSESTFAAQEFDAAFLMWVLEHSSHPIDLLKEARRIVKSSGRIVCTEVHNASLFVRPHCPALESYWAAFNQYQRDLGGDPDIGVRLGSLLCQSGWVGIKIKPVPILMDQRLSEPSDRTSFVHYWQELFLSAAPGLTEQSRVSPELVQAMEHELNALAGDLNAVFYVTAIRAEAQA